MNPEIKFINQIEKKLSILLGHRLTDKILRDSFNKLNKEEREKILEEKLPRNLKEILEDEK